MTNIGVACVIDATRAEECTRQLLGLSLVERLVLNAKSAGARVIVAGDQAHLPERARRDVEFATSLADAEEITAKCEFTGLVAANVAIHPKLWQSLLQLAKNAEQSVFVQDGKNAVLLLSRDDVAENGLAFEPPEQAIELPNTRDHFVVTVEDRRQAKQAVKALLKTNWRPHDGIIARLINKHISVNLSRFLVRTGITPNQMTAFAFVTGLVGVVFAGLGYYWSFLLGASLLQLQSILDGCDGELARMRYLSSAWGAWFDTIVDDILGVSWVAALGLGAYGATGNDFYMWFGLGSAGLYAISVILLYVAVLRGGGGGHQDFRYWFEETSDITQEYPNLLSPYTWLKFGLKRDFYVFFFWILAIADLPVVATWIASGGAIGWFLVMMLQVSLRGLTVPEKS